MLSKTDYFALSCLLVTSFIRWFAWALLQNGKLHWDKKRMISLMTTLVIVILGWLEFCLLREAK